MHWINFILWQLFFHCSHAMPLFSCHVIVPMLCHCSHAMPLFLCHAIVIMTCHCYHTMQLFSCHVNVLMPCHCSHAMPLFSCYAIVLTTFCYVRWLSEIINPGHPWTSITAASLKLLCSLFKQHKTSIQILYS